MTEAQVAALEQWAREAKKWEMVRTDEWPDAILALCETVRAQGAALRDGVRENWAMQQERDAAVARAEQAESALTEARRVLRIAEWGKRDGWCRVCHKFEDEGHAPDCAIAAVLAQEPTR